MINTKKTIKALISIILIVTLASSIWIGTGNAFIPGQSTVAPKNANYITFEGTAANDSYSSMQYSYVINQWAIENGVYPATYYLGSVGEGSIALTPGSTYFNASKSLRIGMTEFGEFADQGNTGIAYGATPTEFSNTESWASSAINQAYMVQGWVLYMNYSRFYVQRAIEAYSLYSNTNTAESARQVYSWDPTQGSTPVTITSGSLTPSGIQVLYDSARLGVARATTVITDGFYNEAVAQVTVTVIFDKTTKYAIVYYDVKIILDPKVLIQINDFVFQKKYEIDLARNVNPSNAAFVHYYSNYSQSVYQDPLTGNYTYDVIQAYDPAHQYIFFDGIYPMATEYSVASPLVPTFSSPIAPFVGTTLGTSTVTKLLPAGTAIADIPLPIGEPNTPVVSIQWNYTSAAYPKLTDFLTKSPNREIRFTDVYGMTNYNSDPSYAIDANDTSLSGINRVDAEVQYLLKGTVFNPVDLTTVALNPALWVAVGSGSSATDSAGAAAMASLYMPWSRVGEPLGLFDANDSTRLGSIPYGLSNVSTTSYTEIFNNLAKGSGSDATTYQAFGLINFAFGNYDGTSGTTPQPVSGGYSRFNIGDSDHDGYFWYPAKDPLTERWIQDDGVWFYGSYAGEGVQAQYDTVTWHPNGIITVGGEKANGITRYFNDFNFAIDREGTGPTDYSALVSGFPQTITGAAPSSIITGTTVDFFPLSTWNTSSWNPVTQKSGYVNTYGYGPGTAIISIAIDNNGTRGITVAGWNAEDTYWASAWASQFLNSANNAWVPAGTVAIILQMAYPNANSEPTFTIVRDLGTITEFGSNYFGTFYGTFDQPSAPAIWSGNEALSIGTAYPTNPATWWYAKLPTTSTALVQYDS